MLLTLPVLPAFAEESGVEEYTVLAGSDFQPKGTNSDGERVIGAILAEMKKDGAESADGFLFCGDYDKETFGNASETQKGIESLKKAVNGFVESEENMVFVQGNHDVTADNDVGLSPSGNNDREDGAYGVYVIHNADYMWGSQNEEVVKLTAQKLINYLNKKLNSGYDRPIFVISHLPLHYTMRTRNDGDGKFATYIFDALNEAAAKGLNIIFMYGHDHSNGWDDYLGGSSVYLEKGDNILIADKSTTNFKTETLNFTYLNAGFTGYYENNNGADDTLTMTLFRIKGNEVTIARYDKDGLHNLKSEGIKNEFKNEVYYDPNTEVYTSPQKVTLTSVSDDSPIDNIMDYVEGGDSGMRFERVNDLSELVNGSNYLLVYNTTYIMLPKVATKSNSSGNRTGFDISKTVVFGDEVIFTEVPDGSLWTFEKTGGGWYIGDGEKKAVIENSSDQKLKALLKDSGAAFVIGGKAGSFTFTSGSYVLNYNSRGIVNGYTSDPLRFHIYVFKGYSIDVENGSVSGADGEIESAYVGDTITVTADEAPEGKVFDKWVVEEGDVVLADANAASTTFEMTAGALKLAATYKEAPVETDPPVNTDTTPENTDNTPAESDPSESETESTAPSTDVAGDNTDGLPKSMALAIAMVGLVFVAAIVTIIKSPKRRR